MNHVVSHLWPKRPKLNNYFSLVQQFLGVVPHIDAMKRSACIEGMKASAIASQDSDESRVPAEHYFQEVL